MPQKSRELKYMAFEINSLPKPPKKDLMEKLKLGRLFI